MKQKKSSSQHNSLWCRHRWEALQTSLLFHPELFFLVHHKQKRAHFHLKKQFVQTRNFSQEWKLSNSESNYPAAESCQPPTSRLSNQKDPWPLHLLLVKSVPSFPLWPQTPPCPAAPRGWACSLTTAKENDPRSAAAHCTHQDPLQNGGDSHLWK